MEGDIRDRWRANRDLQRETKDDWTLHLGDYGDEKILESDSWDRVDYLDERVAGNETELLGAEKHLASIIRKKLEDKSNTEPFIVLDIGGMNGTTWLRLAEEFEEEVRTSRVSFVVSNLKFVPGSETEDRSLYGHDTKVSKDYVDTTRKKGIVNYVQGNLGRLRRKSISLPNGRELKLEGNCGLIHESSSVSAWSLIPELELQRIPNLLKENGVYISPTSEPSGEKMGNEVQRKYYHQRSEGLTKARSDFVNRHGLRNVSRVEGGAREDEAVKAVIFAKGKFTLELD